MHKSSSVLMFFLFCFILFPPKSSHAELPFYELVEIPHELGGPNGLSDGATVSGSTYVWSPLAPLLDAREGGEGTICSVGSVQGITGDGQVYGTYYCPGAIASCGGFLRVFGSSISFDGVPYDANSLGEAGGVCVNRTTSYPGCYVDPVEYQACARVGSSTILVGEVTNSLESSGFVSAINAAGVFVGEAILGQGEPARGFIHSSTEGTTSLGTLGGTTSTAADISNANIVVGYSMNGSGDNEAFYYTSDAGMTSLGTLGGDESFARGINNQNSAVIVGSSTVPSSESQAHGFVYTAEDGMVDVNSLMSNGSDAIVTDITAINDLGIATATIRKTGSSEDSYALLRPVANGNRMNRDFSGDKVGDHAVYRPSTGSWYVRGNDGALLVAQWGLPGDVALAGDFTGDGIQDLCVWRPVDGNWYICPVTAANGQVSSCHQEGAPLIKQFGLPGDVPLSGDFTGDAVTDYAVFRPSTGTWYITTDSGDTLIVQQWGLPGDLPVVGDYDGDKLDDIAVWRPATGEWYILKSSKGFSTNVGDIQVVQWGLPGDYPMTSDYDGDGITDLVVYRPALGNWYLCTSGTGFDCSRAVTYQFGLPGDIAVNGSFDGTMGAQLVVYRPSFGQWYALNLTNGTFLLYAWGLSEDAPLGRTIATQ